MVGVDVMIVTVVVGDNGDRLILAYENYSKVDATHVLAHRCWIADMLELCSGSDVLDIMEVRSIICES